jgi:hypothetical protein
MSSEGRARADVDGGTLGAPSPGALGGWAAAVPVVPLSALTEGA